MSTTLVHSQRRQRTVEFRLFGPDTLLINGAPVQFKVPGSHELLILLLLAPDKRVPLDELAAVLQVDLYTVAGRKTAAAAAGHLRKALGPIVTVYWVLPPESNASATDEASLVSHDDFVQIAFGPFEFETDLDVCGRLLQEARDAADVDAAIDLIAQARDAIRGEPLEAVPGFDEQRSALLGAQASLPKLEADLRSAFDPGEAWVAWEQTLPRIGAIRSWDMFSLASRLRNARRETVASLQDLPQRTATALDAMPVSIYLGEGDDHVAVEAALGLLLAEVEVEMYNLEPPVEGSWFRRSLARVKSETSHLSAEKIAAEVERKIRMEVFDRQQASIDNQQATGAAALIAALQGEERACIRVGSLLVLKLNGQVLVNNLTQYQLAWLERNQVLLRDPEGLLKALDALADEAFAEPGQLIGTGDVPPRELESRE